MYISPLEVRVWSLPDSPYACFTRPELHVERVTYPVMTPSAARGVLESIFWKPEIHYIVDEIVVLNPIEYFSILRNEVNSRASERSASNWASSGGGFNASEDRAQRNTLALRNVDYIIRAQMMKRADVTEDIAKWRDQFRRRVQRGQCFAQPYLGCREFSAGFGPVENPPEPRSGSMDLGRMLLDIQFVDPVKGSGTPTFFDARLEHGVMRIPVRQV